MQKVKKNNLIIHENDLKILTGLLKTGDYKYTYDQKHAEDLKQELKKAVVLNDEKFPADIVRLNSHISIKEEETDKLFEFVLVTPRDADFRARRISVFAPMGTAVLGFKKGDRIKWNMPTGYKYFTILDVKNN